MEGEGVGEGRIVHVPHNNMQCLMLNERGFKTLS